MTLRTLKHQAQRLLGTGEQGQTLVEYALIIVLISIGTFAALTFMKNALVGVFSQIGTAF